MHEWERFEVSSGCVYSASFVYPLSIRAFLPQSKRKKSSNDARAGKQPAVTEALDDIAELFDEAVSHYTSSYTLHIAAANFHGFITMNKHLEGVHLSLAAGLKPPFDVAVWLYLRRKLSKMDSARTHDSKTSIFMRVEFDKQFRLAEDHALEARNDIVSAISSLPTAMTQ